MYIYSILRLHNRVYNMSHHMHTHMYSTEQGRVVSEKAYGRPHALMGYYSLVPPGMCVCVCVRAHARARSTCGMVCACVHVCVCV